MKAKKLLAALGRPFGTVNRRSPSKTLGATVIALLIIGLLGFVATAPGAGALDLSPEPTPRPVPTPASTNSVSNAGGELVHTRVEAASNQDGFVLYADRTRQWVNPDCYADLIEAGVPTRHAQWTTEVQNLKNEAGRNTCTQLKTLLTNSTPATPAQPPTAVPTGTVIVSTSGRASGHGFTNTPIASAISSARPGTVFAFAPGNHAPLTISGGSGSEGNPVVITAQNSASPPVFTNNNYAGDKAGIRVVNSSHIAIRNVTARKTLWGIRVEGSSNVEVDNATVSDIGQEAVRVMAGSSYVTIENSTISETGNRTGFDEGGVPYSNYGEGIYVGTGKDSSDTVHHVIIEGNTITRTTSEAIDIKRPAHNVTVRNNVIRDIRTATSGAVVVHIVKDWANPNPNIRILNNTISNVSTSSPYQDGNAVAVGSTVEVSGNRISNVQHYGIRIEDGQSVGSNVTVTAKNNTFSNIGTQNIWQAGGNGRLLQ